MKYAIKTENINKSYDKIKALNDINIQVNHGEIFGLLGPDGAGKTSLIRILTTLILADSGRAEVMGNDVVKDYKQIRKIQGYMPGKFALYQDLSVEENLKLFATIYGSTIDEHYELIKPIYSQIEPFKKRKAGDLSGGMKQKLALSCCLIHKPEILFLDEPTTGVDPVSRKEFWEMLADLKKENITIFVSTPYMDEAELCDRVALIQNGNILTTDTPRNIRNNFPHTLYALHNTEKYKLLKFLMQFQYTDNVYPFGEAVHYIDKRKQINIEHFKQELNSAGLANTEIELIEPTIEDCFISFMMEKTDG